MPHSYRFAQNYIKIVKLQKIAKKLSKSTFLDPKLLEISCFDPKTTLKSRFFTQK